MLNGSGVEPSLDQRPVVEDLRRRFEDPSPRFGPVPMWWWSGERLEVSRLCWQLDQLRAGGIHQAVVMNLAPAGPLYGALADDPPFLSQEWWAIFEAVCAHAAANDFQLWLYDQLGFSGANLQGHIVAEHPEHAGRRLAQSRADASAGRVSLSAPVDSEPLAAWFVPADGSAARPVPVVDATASIPAGPGELVLAFALVGGFDYFSLDASAVLIDRVYGEYQRHVGHHFGGAIAGAFQDELPNVPGWSHDFPARFRAEAGYDLLPVLAAVFGDPIPEGPIDGPRVRLDYQRVRTRLARQAFFDPLATWLNAAGLPCGFDQQSPSREGSPIGGVAQYGDYLQTHAGYRIPGCDHWGDAKIHSSLAHAHGHQRVWLESFYASGWGGTLEETYDWLAPFFRRGANLYGPHAIYYSTRSGWFEWAPPSTCWRQPYWPDYHRFADAIARLSALLTVGVHVASTVLYSPTEFVQSAITTEGEAAPAADAERIYRELNGESAWISERRGLLDRAGVDYDILNAHALAGATVEGDELVVAAERYRNVILPGAEVLDATVAELLLRFARNGGRVILAGAAPTRLAEPLGSPPDSSRHPGLLDRLRKHAVPVATTGQVVAALTGSRVQVRADAPVLHRSVGDLHLIMAVAHDDTSGTAAPIVPDLSVLWSQGVYSWTNYWEHLRRHGYHFRAPGRRSLRVDLDGVEATGLSAQSWDPRTGRRRDLALTATDTGVRVHADFAAGTFAVIVVGPGLPTPTEAGQGELIERTELTGEWRVHAESTLDNRWGDLDAPGRPGIVPIQVWSFDHTEGDASPRTVTATFGPFAEVTDESGTWAPAEWSLSRGIEKDPLHDQSLGPNGYVPEEFLRWPDVPAGGVRRLRTTITVPERPGIRLAVGANAVRRIRFRGSPLEVDGSGYLSFSEIPSGTGLLELELVAVERADLRASFALTTRPDRFARPEWVVAADAPLPSTIVTARTVLSLSELPADTRVQLSTESATTLVVNGTEVGRQSAFDPQSYYRFTRVHPYDLRPLLRVGENRVEVRISDAGRPASFRLDSVPSEAGGLGIVSSPAWTADRDGTAVPLAERHQQWDDPRYGCLAPRPHPLQDATWLEPAARDSSVLGLVPDLRPEAGRVERLSFVLPVGTTEFTVPTTEPFTVEEGVLDGRTVRLDRPATAGQRATLCFRPRTGRRAGALLDGPVSVRTTESAAPLAPWTDLGLGALGGAVHYRRRLDVPPVGADVDVILDLGELRGAVEVRVDGELVEALFAGPWRVTLTDAVSGGGSFALEVTVRGTLAGYLDVASPTAAVAAGQTLCGLYGPVHLETRRRGAIPTAVSSSDPG